MKPVFAKSLASLSLLCCCALLGAAARADDTAPVDSASASPDDQVVVNGLAVGSLRQRITLAEDAVYARFNALNTDHGLDVQCSMQAELGTRMKKRVCTTAAQREQNANIGEAVVRELQGQSFGGLSGGGGQMYRGVLQDYEMRLPIEMRRLAASDAELGRAIEELGQAHQALEAATGKHEEWTLQRQIPLDEKGLPFNAKRMVDVRVGDDPWTLGLKAQTFTFAAVTGTIRRVEAECKRGGGPLQFRLDVEWTLPAGWDACVLRVTAKRGTTFRFVEF